MWKLLQYRGRPWPRLVANQPSPPPGARSYGRRPKAPPAGDDLAKQLEDKVLWKRRGKNKPAEPRSNEPRRVNVVSKKLCDDIIKYIGPSLERHRGCDLIDLNPGSGLWSRSLHNFLEPRKHVMMDLDAELYRPFLADLLAKDSVHMIPKAGVLWKDLLEMINAQLAHQKETVKGEPPRRNDTLLLTANLCTHPKKPFLGFDSVSTMVLYQLVSSIRSSSLFQKYGLVRMLVWINDEDKRRVLPKALHRRKRSAFHAELASEWIHEVAGIEAEVEDRLNLRDDWVNTESAYGAVQRMMQSGQVMPKGRETRMYTEALARPELLGTRLAGLRTPTFSRPYKQELEELEHELAQPEEMEASQRFKYLLKRDKQVQRDAQNYLGLFQEREAAISLYRKGLHKEFLAADAAFNERVDNMTKNTINEYSLLRDNLHLFRQSPPAMLWDRRAYEPLSIGEEEFFPHAAAALLDIQPRAMHPLLLETGPGSSGAGAVSDVMLRFWFTQGTMPAQKIMDSIAPGFGDLVVECPSLTDPDRGGSPMTGREALPARAINTGQWEEIVQAWMNWPFRPQYSRLLGTIDEEVEVEEEEAGKPSAMGTQF